MRKKRMEGIGRKLSPRYFYVTYVPTSGNLSYYMIVSVLEGSRYGERRLIGKWAFPTSLSGQAGLGGFIKMLKALVKEKEKNGEPLKKEEVDMIASANGGENVDVRLLIERIRKEKEGEYAEMWRRMLKRT